LDVGAWKKVEEGEELIDESESKMEDEVAQKFIEILNENDEVKEKLKKAMEDI